jgi:hypothetical protein
MEEKKMLKVDIFSVDDFGKSQRMFTFGYDSKKGEVVVLFKKDMADPCSFLKHYFTGEGGMFSAKDGQKFIEQLHIGFSNCTRVWASKAYR